MLNILYQKFGMTLAIKRRSTKSPFGTGRAFFEAMIPSLTGRYSFAWPAFAWPGDVIYGYNLWPLLLALLSRVTRRIAAKELWDQRVRRPRRIGEQSKIDVSQFGTFAVISRS